MELRPLQREHYDLILPWFEDTETQRRLGGIYPVTEQLRLIENSPNKLFWLAFEAGVPVGLIELEVEGDIAYPLILVAPTARGRGFGQEIVARIILLANQLKVKKIEAGVAIDNIASGKCFQNAGFEVREEVDGYNYHVFSLPAGSSEK